ncbi:MAG: carbohydrate ABC transporter substrate-binding protein [Lachnospiraceae bacterium]|nr:carbohydrate ABC transporter substrate-binding protein [Lachnospiraceae bacterium]
MKKKNVWALLMAAVMTLSLAACGQTNTPASKTSKAEVQASTSKEESTGGADTADIKVPSYTELNLDDYKDVTASIKFIHHKTDRAADGTMDNMVAEFNKEFPGITVSMEAITDYAEDSLLRLNAGNWGDIMFIPAVDKSELKNYFMPLDSYENLSGVLNFVDAWQFDNICYGIPYMANAQGVLYNKAVFKAAGIDNLPTTPTEFLADLALIKEKTNAIPLYTNYAAGWTMGAWDAYIGSVSNGDDTFMNQKFVHTAAPFADPGDDTGAYNLYRILYEASQNNLIEDDYTTTDWEGSKGMLNRGEIGTMVLGSWAYAQMQEADSHPEDVGYMPFPITVNGTQYALAGGDYNYAINVKSSDENKLASLIFVKWMTEKSGWCYNEGGYTVVKGGKNPDMYSAFDGCSVLSDQPALAGEETFLNDMNNESELSFNAGGNAKVQRIIESAVTGSETLDDILLDWTKAWNAAQKELGIEVKY